MTATPDTIFALSSGQPPAAIAVVRISGPRSNQALEALTGRLPAPRQATLAALRDPATGERLDAALVLRFPAPASATGDDLVELHLHGGRAVVAVVLETLHHMPGLRSAAAGEFTRRAFENGRLDLAEAEGLADLLFAETQGQRRAALAMAGGALSRMVEAWRHRTLDLAAAIEAAIDFSDEGEVDDAPHTDRDEAVTALAEDIDAVLRRPPAERLRDGVRVALAGAPNAGKSSLFNALVGRDAAITSAIAGTTRDLIEAPVALGGVPFLLIDTAGLRNGEDPLEAIGVRRAQAAITGADIVLWLGPRRAAQVDARTFVVRPKADAPDDAEEYDEDVRVSAHSGCGLARLEALLIARAKTLLPSEQEVALNRRQRAAIATAAGHLQAVIGQPDLIIAAEELRGARAAFDAVTGRAGVEEMLDALFGRFCIGK